LIKYTNGLTFNYLLTELSELRKEDIYAATLTSEVRVTDYEYMNERMNIYWKRYAEIINTKFVDEKSKVISISSLLKWRLKSKRLVMTEDGKIFAATVDDIKKYKYRLVENIPKSEWGLEDPDMSEADQEKIEEFRNIVISINTILGSS